MVKVFVVNKRKHPKASEGVQTERERLDLPAGWGNGTVGGTVETTRNREESMGIWGTERG